MTITTDRFGRKWDLPESELCPECGQPDNCGECNHEPYTDDEAATLRGEDIEVGA